MPSPAISAFSVAAQTAYNEVTVSSSNADRVEIYRQYDGEDAVCLSRTFTVGTSQVFTDANPYNDRPAFYYAKAIDDDAPAQAVSATAGATQDFGGAYLHKVVRAATTTKSGSLMLLTNQEPMQRATGVERNVLYLPAYEKPVIETGTTVQRIWRLPLVLADLTDGTLQLLNGFIENHNPLCCRLERGQRLFGLMQRAKPRVDVSADYPLELIEIDFREGIAA